MFEPSAIPQTIPDLRYPPVNLPSSYNVYLFIYMLVCLIGTDTTYIGDLEAATRGECHSVYSRFQFATPITFMKVFCERLKQ